MRVELLEIRCLRLLRPADIVGVTAGSIGISKKLQGRLDFAVQQLRDRGFVVQVADCLDGATHIRAPVEQQAQELMRLFLDPMVKAVVPPWGGRAPSTSFPILISMRSLSPNHPCWWGSPIFQLCSPPLRSGQVRQLSMGTTSWTLPMASQNH
ncbi:LD-carboxypeptidase [Arthrobacter sp. lap29]|uniref:LD-carboxypeptidase n=1 Tax=Arthrobacter sp. lap29 TaxID=3056122 RepID=UPI0037BF9A35